MPTVSARGTYRLFRQVGDLIYLSGHGPMRPDGTFHSGKVGGEVSIADAYQHARLVGRFLLSTLEEAGFALDRIEVVKLLGMVNADSTFGDHPAVINGCSDLLIEELGERGEHARAVGLGHARSGVVHPDLHRVLAGAGLDQDPALPFHRLHRVQQHVQEHVVQRRRVAVDERQLLGEAALDLDASGQLGA